MNSKSSGLIFLISDCLMANDKSSNFFNLITEGISSYIVSQVQCTVFHRMLLLTQQY